MQPVRFTALLTAATMSLALTGVALAQGRPGGPGGGGPGGGGGSTIDHTVTSTPLE